jgi:hypothetical protein
LCNNASLQKFGLGRDSVFNDGTTAIADALKDNFTMARLYLDGISISDEGALALLTALRQYNRTLTLLSLENNDEISPLSRKAVDFALASRWVLGCLRKRLRWRTG